MLYYLQLIKEGYEPTEISLKGAKFDNIWSSMIRKGLVSESKLTLQGEDLLSFLSEKADKPKLSRRRFTDEPFDLWWKAYPATDTFTANGRMFKGSRALKVKKDDCKSKLNNILNSGDYTINELVSAIKLEVQQKVESSLKTTQNKLSYMQNSLTYLNQATYDPFVELIRAGHKVEEEEDKSVTGGVEI